MDFAAWSARTTQITDGVWVGEIASRTCAGHMQRAGIVSVLSILSAEHQSTHGARHPLDRAFRGQHMTFDYDDGDYIDPGEMHGIVGPSSLFESGVTLVHCISGANRSTAVTLARLLYQGLDAIAAANLYWGRRGKSIAEVYGAVPRMSGPMERSVVDYASALTSGRWR